MKSYNQFIKESEASRNASVGSGVDSNQGRQAGTIYGYYGPGSSIGGSGGSIKFGGGKKKPKPDAKKPKVTKSDTKPTVTKSKPPVTQSKPEPVAKGGAIVKSGGGSIVKTKSQPTAKKPALPAAKSSAIVKRGSSAIAKRSGAIVKSPGGSIVKEVYDKDIAGSSQIKKQGEGGRVGANRKKSEAETRRMKAVGGGKMAPVTYKDRKDIGSQRQTSTREQQPTKERGSAEVKQSYADKVKAERRKAAQARIAAKKGGGEVKKDTTSSKDASKQATKLLSTKKTEKKPVNPNYKPAKASGMTRQERMKVTRKGETALRGIFKDQETAKYKKETGTNPDAKGRTKIMGRVHKRMST